MMNFIFNNATKLLFGTGRLGELHNETLPGKKALLLTSNGKSTHQKELLSDPVLKEIADAHQKSIAQVILR